MVEPSEAERSACVLAAHRLREAVLRERCLYMPVSFPLKFDGGLREALRACLPRELSSGGSCHSQDARVFVVIFLLFCGNSAATPPQSR